MLKPPADRRPRRLRRAVGLCIVTAFVAIALLSLRHGLAVHNIAAARSLWQSATLCSIIGYCATGANSTAIRLPAGSSAISEAQKALTTRACGSPAVDAYAHVKPQCLEQSPTAAWWREHPGELAALQVHIERHADYDGLAVFWGINNKKASAEDCAAQCRAHKPGTIEGPVKNLPCNAFVWCADEECFEPDAHRHTRGDCWLKFTEAPAAPEVNMRGKLPDSYRRRHPKAPEQVQWVAGVLLPPGVKLGNGTWSPRWFW